MRNQTNHVYQELRQRIIDGVLRPAESLTEMSLAAALGTSRSTIRKALLKLESENLITIEENKRARVRSFSIEEAIQYLEVRELLEGFVIRQGTPLIGDSELQEMRETLLKMKTCLDAREFLQYSQCNWLFHEIVYRVCPNKPAVEMIRVIKNQLKQFNIKTVLIPGRGDESFAEHSRILSALERRDAKEAEVQIRKHLANVRVVLQKNFQLLL